LPAPRDDYSAATCLVVVVLIKVLKGKRWLAMKAVRIHGVKDVRVEEQPDIVVEPNTVALSGGYTGVCGTDLHLYFEPEAFPGDFLRPAKLTGATWPQILGHEFSGVVTEVGAGVIDVVPGDSVAVFPYHFCGECPACSAGHTTDCEHMAFEGIQGRCGGMAQTKLVSANQCFKLPPGVDLILGALVEPMAVGWHGVTVSKVKRGESALVLGGGPIGIGTYFALRAKGVWPVIVSEPMAERRAILKRAGVEIVVDPAARDLLTEVRRHTSGQGVAATIDTAGSPEAFIEGMQCLAVDGRMVTIALYKRPIPLTRHLLAAGRSIRSSAVYSRDDFHQVIQAMQAGLISLKGDWIRIVDFEDVVQAMEAGRAGDGMKVLVRTPETEFASNG